MSSWTQMWTAAATAAAVLTAVRAQQGVGFPHVYPGQPSGDYSPAWQSYFEVTEKLPNVTFDLTRNFAGNIAVGRAGHPNNTLFFWGFEKTNGSLTSGANETNNEPWGIWLNGGPGSSSLIGLTTENGPVHIQNDYSAVANDKSWNKIADYIWVDQPVGVGFGTVDKDGFAGDEDQMGIDFMGFLTNLVKVFPSLATRPLHLTGESYAGTYIPYITKTLFSTDKPPVNLKRIAIGDGTVASGEVFELLPVPQVLETYPQIIGYDPEVLDYFKGQAHLCGYDLNLTYPQTEKFPSLVYKAGELDLPLSKSSRKAFRSKQTLEIEMASRYAAVSRKRSVDRMDELKRWKRDLSGRANGTLDPWYACDLYDEMLDYAINFTYPWSLSKAVGGTFDVYDIPDALSPEAPMDPSVFLNDNRTRAALHAPTSKDWIESINYLFDGPDGQDPSVEPMAFLDDLATNATNLGVSVVLFSGNDDSLVAHPGTEVAIQNTTFGGIQGFTKKPSTPWYDDSGNFAGIVHQERNWTYVLVANAGHLIAYNNPSSAFVLAREFLFGNNQTGLVTNSSGGVSVVGGENSSLAGDFLPGQAGIFVGSGTTQSTYFFPSATVAAWEQFIHTATATASPGTEMQASSSRREMLVSLGTLSVATVISAFFLS
ncbi:hypothetical protein PLICRDRAFT_44287 [Plicaturopsis crispa FD-325 SS-3]|nr:hypothetical protein PLICRDRAFT_44287 [Plicaturopsis crispa FD-325 SS-3]